MTGQDISGVRYINYKECNARKGMAPQLEKYPIHTNMNGAMKRRGDTA
jgi:hypothetical protein